MPKKKQNCKTLPLAKDKKGGCRGPQGFLFFEKKFHQIHHHQPNQRFFLKCFFFLTKFSQ
jgi:hypothetical protein